MSIEKLIDRYATAITEEGYGILIALAATVVFAVVWRIATAPRRPAVMEPISATELAFLRSDIAPVVTALAALRAEGRITQNRRVDRAVRSLETDRFTGRVLERVGSDPEHTVPGLYAASRDDLEDLEQQLSERGLMRTHAERARMRWGTAPSIVVMLLGIGYIVYLVTQLSEHPEYTASLMVLLTVTVLFATLILPHLLGVDRLTRAGRRLLAAEQKRLAYLEPAKKPAFDTYGPAAVAMSVALFGTGALWAFDSDYSSAVELAGDSSGGSDGGGCGASCGGGDGGGG
ncbi:TIGR04222 domain-containing membrane protein, partial [Mycolicibacterium mageritense]|uniref:TIGR04222 domain-containing membrane protein n=1 Tax=Mycolicibacterium mageritense TaxID=53462 RepID=UPI0011D6BAC8